MSVTLILSVPFLNQQIGMHTRSQCAIITFSCWWGGIFELDLIFLCFYPMRHWLLPVSPQTSCVKIWLHVIDWIILRIPYLSLLHHSIQPPEQISISPQLKDGLQVKAVFPSQSPKLFLTVFHSLVSFFFFLTHCSVNSGTLRVITLLWNVTPPTLTCH